MIVIGRDHPRARGLEPRAQARRGAAPHRPRRPARRSISSATTRRPRGPLRRRRHDEDQRQHLHPQGHGALLGELQPDVHRDRRHLRLPRHHRRLLLLGAQPPPLRQARRSELPAELPARARALRHGRRATWSANLNFFMYVPVGADGAMDMGPSISKPGDYVELRAEMDVLAVVSNCPQMNNPVNDFNPTPVRALVYRGERPPAAR